MSKAATTKEPESDKAAKGSSGLEKFMKDILPTIGVITGSLSGTGVVFTAIGYLAERSHLAMLGFTNVPVDLNQYLYTGLKIVALLPAIILLIPASIIDEWLFKSGNWVFITVVLSFLAVFRLSLEIPRLEGIKENYKKIKDITQDQLQRMRAGVKNNVGKYRSFFFMLIILVQIFGLFWLTNVKQVNNLIFQEHHHASAVTELDEASWYSPDNSDKLACWILHGDQHSLPIYFVKLFAITVFSILIFFYMMSTFSIAKFSVIPKRHKVFLSMSIILLITEVLYLPINFGALLLANQYPEVEVKFKKNHAPVVHNAINDLTMEADLPAYHIRNLDAAPRVFRDPDGDFLNYSAESSNDKVALAEIISKHCLRVSLVDTGTAKITVTAADDSSENASVAFQVTGYLSEDEKLIPRQVMKKNQRPFLRDLSHYPRIFGDLDLDSLQSHSSDTSIATVCINGGILEVSPQQPTTEGWCKPPAHVCVAVITVHGAERKTDFKVKVVDTLKNQDPIAQITEEIHSSWNMDTGSFHLTTCDSTILVDLRKIFTDADEDDILTYTAGIANQDTTVAINVIGNDLLISPISAGHAVVNVFAYDGKGSRALQQIKVKVSRWIATEYPTLLLHQTGNLFYLYFSQEKKISLVRHSDISSIQYKGLANIF